MRNNNHRRRDTVTISGWVYADLLLGLMILFLVSTKGVDPRTLTPEPTFTPTPTATRTQAPTYTSPTRRPTITPTPTDTPTPTPTPTPTITPTPAAVGVSTEAFTVMLHIDPAWLAGYFARDAEALRRVDEHLKRQMDFCFAGLQGRVTAGFVLSFGHNADGGRGNTMAATANRLMAANYPDIFGSVPMRNYHQLTKAAGDAGKIEVETYFITQPGVEILSGQCDVPAELW